MRSVQGLELPPMLLESRPLTAADITDHAARMQGQLALITPLDCYDAYHTLLHEADCDERVRLIAVDKITGWHIRPFDWFIKGPDQTIR